MPQDGGGELQVAAQGDDCPLLVQGLTKGLSAEEWSTLGTLGSVLPAPESKGLSADDLATLGTLGSVLPALEELHLIEPTAGTDGVQRLAERLGAGALPALSVLSLARVPGSMHVGDAGASALAAALGRGALPRLQRLWLALYQYFFFFRLRIFS